jgi:nicotinic acid phosphoribosyltransferase
MARLDPSVFGLPVARLREGYYSDAYLNHVRVLLAAEDRHPRVLMQVFQKHESTLGGIDEAIAVLRLGSGREGSNGVWQSGWDELEVRALSEGDAIAPMETVLTIEGDYGLFAHLETVYLGCLARRSLVMRNVRAVVRAAGGKPILFFPARHDHWLVQSGDGRSATAMAVPAESLSKSTSTVTFISDAKRRANASAAATVSPPNAAIRLCGTVPIPRPPHHEAWASVETPMAPATCADHPSPDWTSQ